VKFGALPIACGTAILALGVCAGIVASSTAPSSTRVFSYAVATKGVFVDLSGGPLNAICDANRINTVGPHAVNSETEWIYLGGFCGGVRLGTERVRVRGACAAASPPLLFSCSASMRSSSVPKAVRIPGWERPLVLKDELLPSSAYRAVPGVSEQQVQDCQDFWWAYLGFVLPEYDTPTLLLASSSSRDRSLIHRFDSLARRLHPRGRWWRNPSAALAFTGACKALALAPAPRYG